MSTIADFGIAGALLSLILACLFLVQYSKPYQENSDLRVKDGVLDLRGIDFTGELVFPLSGNWELFWQQQLTGSASDSERLSDGMMMIPGNWKGQRLQNQMETAALGYGTLHLKILTDDTLAGKSFLILLPHIRSSFGLFLKTAADNSPVFLTGSGKVASSEEGYYPDIGPRLVEVTMQPEMELYLQVSNFSDAYIGGVLKTPMLGGPKGILYYDREERQAYFFIMGAILMVGVISLILYIVDRSEPSTLWLAIFSFLIALRVFIFNDYLHEVFPEAPLFWLFHKVYYLTTYVSTAVYLVFLSLLFPRTFKNPVVKGLIVLICVLSAFTVFTPTTWYSAAFGYYLWMLVACFVVIIFYYIETIKIYHNLASVIAFLGTLGVFIFALIDTLSQSQSNHLIDTVQIGLLINVIAMGFIVALNNALVRKKSVLLSDRLKEEINARKVAEEDINRLNRHLERKVEYRTAELQQTHDKLVVTAHLAGKAEIAAETLHNVGNILNSIKTSIHLLSDGHAKSEFKNLKKANEIIRENIPNIKEFISEDPRGPKVLEYYLLLEQGLQSEQDKLAEQLTDITENIDAISEVIASQHLNAGGALLKERCSLVETVDELLQIWSAELDRLKIKVVRSFQQVPSITVQKPKLIYILNHIIQNAVDAMTSSAEDARTLEIALVREGSELLLSISDSGCGIKRDHLPRIFKFGFSTKEKTFSFGLHSSANFMSEMKGRIWAESEGENQGSTFSLGFPLT